MAETRNPDTGLDPAEDASTAGALSLVDRRVAMLREKVAKANVALEEAVQEMDRAVAELSPVLLGDKRMTSETVDRSFHRLREAQASVQDLERLLGAALAAPRA